jgi:hypothetical protein
MRNTREEQQKRSNIKGERRKDSHLVPLFTIAPYTIREDFYADLQNTYQIPSIPNNSFDNPNVKVLGIGADISGIMMAQKIQMSYKNVD